MIEAEDSRLQFEWEQKRLKRTIIYDMVLTKKGVLVGENTGPDRFTGDEFSNPIELYPLIKLYPKAKVVTRLGDPTFAATKNDRVSGIWKGTQQGRYLVNVEFDLRLDQATGKVSGTAHFKNTERPVQADGRITKGKLDTSSDRAKLILTVLYIGGLQEGTDVTFTRDLGRDGILRGEGVNAWNKTLALELSKEKE